MKLLRLLLLILLGTSLAHTQLALGPKSGSIPGGVIVLTDTFPQTPRTVRSLSIKSRREIHPPLVSQPKSVTDVSAMSSLIVKDTPNGVADLITQPLIVQDFAGIPDQGIFPAPDPIIAVGPNHVMACVNTRFRIWDKQGITLKTIEAADWYSTTLLPRDWFIFDPKIRYDHFANRWLMVWLVDDGGGAIWGDTAYYLLSVSDDDNPLGTWYNWAIPSNTVGDSAVNNDADYEGVGFDETALYICSKQYRPPEGTYQYDKVRIFEKTQFFQNDAGPISWTDFWDLRDPATGYRVTTLRPAITFGTSGQYFLINSVANSPGSYYTLWKIYDPLGVPSINAVNIPATTYRYQIYADQLGGGTKLVNSSGKLRTEPVYRDSSLWFVHCVASGTGDTYSSIRYLRINPFTNTLKEDVIFGQEGYWYFYPALMVDKFKDLVITYSRSSLTEYVGAYLCGRRDSDPPGLSTSVPLKYGESNYVRLDWWGNNRWGDYMGAALDPTDEEAIWSFTEYAASPANTWGTWVGKVKIHLGAPILGSPPNNETHQPTTLTLQWNPSPGASEYHLQVSIDSLFAATVYEDSSLTVTSQQVGPLDTTKYYWRVRGKIGGWAGAWSSIWNFTTIPEVTQQYTVRNRWNIVSVPLTVSNYSKATLFPTAVSDALAFQNSYTAESVLANGVGYWLKFGGAQTIEITGAPKNVDTLTVNEGWNLIGSISLPVPVETITSDPGCMISSNFFGYSNSYQQSDTLFPSKGYWVKVKETGKLILSASPTATELAKRIRIVTSNELPPPSPDGKEKIMANEIPDAYLLEQNYPNPFNPATTFTYGIPERSRVTLDIYNVLGQIVARLVNVEQEPGYSSVDWIASNGIGSGLYFYRLTAASVVEPGRMFVQVRKMVLIK